MTDKEKIIAYIDKLLEKYPKNYYLLTVAEFIDSLPKEPVSEGLGEYINKLSKQFPEVSFAKLSRIAVRVVKWKEQQMMAKAVDAVVKIDAGGYPYVDRTIELYDYDKDIPLAKRGDKVKILVIKEK